jgi:hypothetical protein
MNRLQRLVLSLLGLPLLLAACSRPEPPPEPVRVVRTLVISPTSSGGSQDYAAEIRARS